MNTQWVISNAHVRIASSEASRGGLVEMTDRRTRRNFMAAAPHPLYRVVLSNVGSETIKLTSHDAKKLLIQQSQSPDQVRLEFDRHRDLDLKITCTVRLPADSLLSYWRITV